MKIHSQTNRIAASLVLLTLSCSVSVFAQDGKLTIHVIPKQAYAFVDGRAFSEASRHALRLSAGDHKIDLYNYGYAPASSSVSITAGKNTNLEVTLTPIDTQVSGPLGAMTIEGADRDAVLLNGKSPDFFVGHGDEFNHNWWWKQELVVPAGTYQVTILGAGTGNELWSGPVEVPLNQRVVLDIPKGVRKTVPWPRGETLGSLARFKAGTASATVAVAKPTAQLSASTAQINCGDAAQLKWSSSDSPHVEINGLGLVTTSGVQSVQPKQTTAYELTASGPGGTATSSSTVTVSNSIQADLEFSPAEIHYKQVGDKVVEQSGTSVNWTAANADAVSIDPLGSVSPSGNRTVQVAPRKTDAGPVDETITYTLSATNNCGGTETKTATLHIVGSIEPQLESMLSLNSIYFPTDQPSATNPNDGLLASQQSVLKLVADDFKKYLAAKPDARLILSGHADERGPTEYNQALSERRVEVAKRFLVEQGIPANNIETRAHGKDENLNAEQVGQQMEQNPNLSAEARQKASERMPTTVLANNRRVDVSLSTTGQESVRQYPFQAEDFSALVNRNGLETEGEVKLASERKKIQN